MTVFVVHKPRPPRSDRPGEARDLTPAAEHGHVEFIFEPSEQTSMMPGQAIRKCRQVLDAKNFGDNDLLVWAGGDPASLLIAGGVMLDMNRGTLNYLRWERERIAPGEQLARARTGFYMPAKIKVW